MKRVALLLLLTWLLPDGTQALLLFTEEYPPVAFSDRDGQAAGMAVEVAQEILRRMDQPASLQVVPWSRAYRIAQTTPDTAIFPTMRTAEREPQFKWVGPILLTADNFYALKGSGIVIRDQQELSRVRQIAVPRDWFTYQQLRAAGMTNLLGVNEPSQMFQLLRVGRVPLILADNVLFYARPEAVGGKQPLRPHEVEVVYPYQVSYGYITFWVGTDDAEIQRWQAALDEMKRDGTFSLIYQRWLPGAEEPGLREPDSTIVPPLESAD